MPNRKKRPQSKTLSTAPPSKTTETKKSKAVRRADLDSDQSIIVTGRVEEDKGVYVFEGNGYTLRSIETGEEVLRNLRIINPNTEEYKAITDVIKKQESPPRYFKETEPIYLDADGGLYYDTNIPKFLKNFGPPNKPTELYLPGEDLEENSGYYFYQPLPPNQRNEPGQLLYFKVIFKGEGGGFGSARSDVPGDYRWFGSKALGYALSLNMEYWSGELDQIPNSVLAEDQNCIKVKDVMYFKANTPRDLTGGKARVRPAASQSSEIVYFKKQEDAKLQHEEKKYFRQSGNEEKRYVFNLAPELPHRTRIPTREVRQSNFSASTTLIVSTDSNANPPSSPSKTETSPPSPSKIDTSPSSPSKIDTSPTPESPSKRDPDPLPPKPSDLFDPSSYETRYEKYTKQSGYISGARSTGQSVREFKEDFRKKARLMAVSYAGADRDDTATQVYKAVRHEYVGGIDKFVSAWRAKRGQTSSTKNLPATAYCDYLFQNFDKVESVKGAWMVKYNLTDAQAAEVRTAQEWCHLHGHAAGGPDKYYNFVSGSHYANTEQLAIEMGHKVGRYPNLKISITAYRLLDTDIAVWIRYKIFYGNEKIFDHVFDGQSEQFDYNEYKILETTVRRVVAGAAARDPTAAYKDAAEKYEAAINAKIAVRATAENWTKEEPPYVYSLPPVSVSNVNTNDATTNSNNNNNSNNTGSPTTSTTTGGTTTPPTGQNTTVKP